jgi:uncharacterized protein (TIGR02145 family)
MKKLLLLSAFLIFACSYGQGEQLYADGTATDQDGNSFEWISYGSQDWAIENAEVVTYRDGTLIPQVTADAEWANLTTGAWCYYNNDPSKGKLYNWYAVAGIHDNEDTTPNKEFAPEGWHVATDTEWITLENYLIDRGYNYDIFWVSSKAMSSTTGWNACMSGADWCVGINQSLNNSSGFNAFPEGIRQLNGFIDSLGKFTAFWCSTVEGNTNSAWSYDIAYDISVLHSQTSPSQSGFSVRFVRDTSTASTENNQSNTITIYPNPTTSILTIKGNKAFDIKVYDMTGRKIMTHTGNTIDMSNLSPATYIIKAVDNSNNEEFTYKVIKD